MKQRAYAAGVVSIYRRYVDQYLEKGRKGYHVSEKDRRHFWIWAIAAVLPTDISPDMSAGR